MGRTAVRFGSPLAPASRAWLVVGAGLALLATTAAARAQSSPESVEFAAHEHDLGYRAYTGKAYEEAATHFENAFFAAPNPAELRSAIRARRDAGQPARAATLSALGKRRFPADAALGKTADETIAAVRGKVYEIKLASPEECQLTVDGKVLLAERAREVRFFVDPGKRELSVGWSDDRVQHVSLDAVAGGTRAIDLEPPARVAAPPTPTPPATSPAPSAETVGTPSVTEPRGKPLPPLVFWAGVGLTAVGAGLTTWSGIDTLDDPGTSAVRSQCTGQGTSCPAYQKGLASQTRTNALLASTAGVAVLTAALGVFFTDWSRAPATAPASGLTVRPSVGPDGASLVGSF